MFLLVYIMCLHTNTLSGDLFPDNSEYWFGLKFVHSAPFVFAYWLIIIILNL